ncbi:hypothetical protein A3D05_03430 [Candidatus Gottesmanbacteria bacterium RIFCSPHIGHO2_02_FULL_40_24]|uniref:GHMP kinase N-terminal domain-containing protein n=1 Tax=Candidatus Gottesmanbacteria bacterium RIFCSPHIGHO2_01_FULL_40_15 TaxID=1798376 RepID=A0A1F5Z0L5_9BACT|nr:MAG: hypothetical protein A2777_02555 [Candidatus Gottesmanbacteria bacterium RIFCSPHIGHO2_01_FULL_40_15]OGG17885.1 MAG: hypothetical protein A3D05_03430 [Candidatus Gottesmanbacteria bacterium RIFCSPHIGHO2_02_FULL_40_24]OGG21752.1 MAG: hypothetical protein A3B48_03580 [Candidatus Gottesmanbacteria bacterium RIFCSPLOWO2_01_FULL_40_10]OGG24726.1 MAG: hypothetical protein A3E42_01610 [Candidatus Gottesmanbacteria bacterium RIFCSPHIGHO2_12_FULL_40_13]
MKKVTVKIPCAVSFIFKAFLPPIKIEQQNLLALYGSTGVGCTINKFVYAEASPANTTQVTFNKKVLKLPTIEKALKMADIGGIKLKLKSDLPLSCGFGISGAATLASIISGNRLYGNRKKSAELIRIAHNAEILAGTGLGTVVTQTTGGFLLKTKPGIPAEYKSFSFVGRIIYAYVFGPIATPKILSDSEKISNINKNADRAISEIVKIGNPGLSDILEISYNFCRNTNLLNNTSAGILIEKIRKKGGLATMAILGDVVLSDMKISDNKSKIYRLKIVNEKAEII